MLGKTEAFFAHGNQRTSVRLIGSRAPKARLDMRVTATPTKTTKTTKA